MAFIAVFLYFSCLACIFGLSLLYLRFCEQSRRNCFLDWSQLNDFSGSDKSNLGKWEKNLLPKNFLTSDARYRLERRAIFGTQWLYVAHMSRFKKAGDYQTFEIAGYSIFLILGKDSKIRAFHNVCRHRAYTITKKECGSSLVLACRYHGWSYNTKGELIKAPEFDNVAGFEKLANGLFELKSLTKAGLVFVNFNNGNVEACIPKVPSFINQDMTLMAEWAVNGCFNWKLSALLANQTNDGLNQEWKFVGWLFEPSRSVLISPNTILRRMNRNSVLVLKFLPIAATKTHVHCSWYTTATQTENAKSDISAAKEGVNIMIKELLEFQSNHSRPFAVQPITITYWEAMEVLVTQHKQKEATAGFEVNPAALLKDTTHVISNDDALCHNVEQRYSTCQASANGLLDW